MGRWKNFYAPPHGGGASDHAHVVVVHFNPWHFQSEVQLLRGFFETLAQALGRSLPTMKEKIGKIIKDYGSLLSLVSISVGNVVQVAPGDAAKGLGEALSTVELDELQTRIEHILAEAGKRVVVLIKQTSTAANRAENSSNTQARQTFGELQSHELCPRLRRRDSRRGDRRKVRPGQP